MKKKFPKDKIIRAILSLIMAIFLWIMATANTNPNVTIRYSNITINYENLPEGLIVDNPINTVNIKLNGPTSQMNKVSRSDIKASVDLSEITTAGEYTLEVSITGIPDEISVSDISSRYLLVKLGNYVASDSEIKIETTGTLPSGYVLLNLDHSKENVSVSGSDNITEKISQIKGILDITGKTSDFSADVTLGAYDAEGNLLENVNVSPTSLNVNASIGITKTVAINAVTEGNCADGFNLNNISLSKNEITISGRSSALSSISSIDTLPISLSGKNESFDVQLEFQLPTGVYIYSAEKYTAHLQIDSVASKTLTYNNLQVRNTPQNLTCTFTDFSTLNITLLGQQSVLDVINEDSVVVFIDLNGLSAGEHTVNIQYEMPKGVTISSSSQETVAITLSGE